MATLLKKSELLKLTVEQRLKLMDLIWQTFVEQDADIPMSPDVLAEMERRFTEARKDPDGGISLDELERRVRNLK